MFIYISATVYVFIHLSACLINYRSTCPNIRLKDRGVSFMSKPFNLTCMLENMLPGYINLELFIHVDLCTLPLSPASSPGGRHTAQGGEGRERRQQLHGAFYLPHHAPSNQEAQGGGQGSALLQPDQETVSQQHRACLPLPCATLRLPTSTRLAPRPLSSWHSKNCLP